MNLINNAIAMGISPNRIMFATRVPKRDHILRHRAVDLFLEDNSPKRNAFVLEFESGVELMRENDWDQFYAFADIIMQKYS